MLTSLAFENQLTAVAIGLLATATVVGVVDFWQRRDHRVQVFGLLISAVLVLGAAVVVRWVREGQGPFLTMYDILLSNAFSLGLLFLVIAWRLPVVRGATLFACPVLLLLSVWMLLVPAAAVPLPATFDNYWLWVHVASGKLFLGVCLASVSAAGILLVTDKSCVNPRVVAAEDLVATDRAVWGLFFLAFVCHSLMLLSGAVWAHSAWGRYWSWDPLETWTLVTWLGLGAVLHVRATFKNVPAGVGYTLIVLVFVLAFLTFLGVPLVSSAPHKGVM